MIIMLTSMRECMMIIIPVDRLNVAGADQSTHSVLSTYIERDNYVPIDGIKVKHTWDLPR